MWEIAVKTPWFGDERLAALSVESPLNLRTDKDFGIIVALWCGRIHQRLEVDGTPQGFTYGFLAGEVVVDPAGGRIRNHGRLEKEAGRSKIVRSEKDESKKGGTIEGGLGAEIGKWLGIAKATANLGGHFNRTVSKTEQKDGEYYEVAWRIADAGHNFWRVFGTGLTADGVLENKIIGDEPLCFIAPDNSDSVEVVVSFRCDLRDLWFERDPSFRSSRDIRFDFRQEERNRNAIAARVIALALNREINAVDPVAQGPVILAHQKLYATKNDVNSNP